MNANVGGLDRLVRISVGLALVAYALISGTAWAWVGLVPLATGVFGFCPPYALLGWSTCSVKKPG